MSRWWWGAEHEAGVFARSLYLAKRFRAEILLGSECGRDVFHGLLGRASSPLYTYLAWRYPEEAEIWMYTAYLAALHRLPSGVELSVIRKFLAKDTSSFPDLLQQAHRDRELPRQVLRNSRPSFGLMARNLNGPATDDLYIFKRNDLLAIALEPIFPRLGYLPRQVMRNLIADFAWWPRPDGSV